MEVSCPISAERVNESVIRIVAFIVAIIAVVCIAFGNYYAMIFLMVDFAIRAFTSGKWSVLKAIALQVFKVFSLPTKMTDLAPKKFAATLGFVFCLLISAVYILQFDIAALILTSVLLVFAILESVFAICVGCYVYSFWQMIFNDK
ncbi:DUF4395 family protein [Pedobacter sp. LMG 31464]|uniref:DUF4395 family protein n=1 Tax=Pedobacter planticolens TaxID=2679964 RepID=A0A923ITZ7_9SPHI|nr:DUF4395 domain-containing protein [Pedobacter planticolens]MBB2144223.1 DUF4395 family protein [Pedobacter planticolens]